MLTITDKVFTPGAAGLVPAVGQAVLISASVVPTLVSSGGKYYDLLSQNQRVVTDANGQWSVQLPWPSELDPNTSVTWLIRLPDGVTFGGTVPEGVVGPLTIRELKNSYSWAIVVGGATQAVTVVGTGIPAQAGHVGQFLQTDGTNVSWAPAAGASTGNWAFSGNIADLTGAGAMQVGNTTATGLQLGTAGYVPSVPGGLSIAAGKSIANTAQGATNTTGLTIQPNVADGASSVALAINSSASLASGKLAVIQNAGTTKASINADGSITMATNGTGLKSGTGSGKIFTDDATGSAMAYGAATMAIGSTSAYCNVNFLTNGGSALGQNGTPWPQVWAQLNVTVNGGAIASATTISPTTGVHHITGTTQINTINVPCTGFIGSIVLIPDAAFTTGTSGNIAIASTAVIGRALTMTYDGTKWYPSY